MPAEEAYGDLDLRDYLRVLRRRKVTIASTVLLIVGAAVAFSLLQTPVYEATAEVLVHPRTSEQALTPNGGQSPVDPVRAINTEIKLFQSPTVQDAVRAKLGRVPAVSSSAAGQADVIAVTSRSANPKQAARDANTYARTYLDVRRKQAVDDLLAAGRDVQAQINDLQRQIDALPPSAPNSNPNSSVEQQRSSLLTQQTYYRTQLAQLQVSAQISQVGGGQVVSRATSPGSPVEPKLARTALIALALGLLLGIGLAFLRDRFDDSIKVKEDFEHATGLPVVGLIPAIGGWKNQNVPYLVTTANRTSQPAEAYRTLRTSVQFLGLDHPIRTLQVTSPAREEGKTTTLVNLGVALAEAGQRVTLVDCDLRRPRLHQFFSLSNDIGFTSVLLGSDTQGKAVQGVEGYPALAVLASGPPPPNPSELLSSPRTRDILAHLQERSDYLLIDSPPVLPVTDAVVLSRIVDGMLLVASAGQTTKRAAQRAVEVLRQVDAPLLGAVFNNVRVDQAYGYAYGYGYEGAAQPVPEPQPEPNGEGRRSRTANL